MERKQVLYQLQKDLQLSEVPVHIECFDNSNFREVTRYRQWFVLKMACQVKMITGGLM